VFEESLQRSAYKGQTIRKGGAQSYDLRETKGQTHGDVGTQSYRSLRDGWTAELLMGDKLLGATQLNH